MGSNNYWDLSDPTDSLQIQNIPTEIRDFKEQMETRLEREHTTLTDSSTTDCYHKEGSARAFHVDTEPTAGCHGEPIGANDEGCLWIDSDDGVLQYYDGSAWQYVVTGSSGSYVVLAGTSGGQIVRGGTDSGDDLTLAATSNSGGGSIIFEASSAGGGGAYTTDLQFDSIPQYGVMLGEDANGGGKDWTNLSTGVKTAGEALVKGSASIAFAELLSTGNVVGMDWGYFTGATGIDKTITTNITPQFLAFFRDSGAGAAYPCFWFSGLGTEAIGSNGNEGTIFTSAPSGTSFTLDADHNWCNLNGCVTYWIAIQFRSAAIT